VQVAAVTGPITISGVGTGSTVNLYGVHSAVTNTASGSPTVNDYNTAQTGADGDTLETLSDQLDAIEADTQDLQTQVGTDGAGLTALPWNATWDAEVQSEATDALNAYDPPTKAELDSAAALLATAAALAVVDGIVDDILVDTGATIPATLAGLATAAALAVVDANVDAIKVVTDSLDVSAVTQVAANDAGHLTITAALTFDEGVTGLTIPADWKTALWTLKADASKPDTAALVQLRETNPAALTDGIVRLNGAAVASPLTAASGALLVTQASGRIDIYLTDEATALLDDATGLGWDVKFIDAAGDSTGYSGTADVALTETKATA
jgi:hypothetical protein